MTMKQINSQLKKHINQTSSLSVADRDIKKLILHILLSSFGLLALLYLVLLGNMVKNIAERKNLETKALALANEMSNLELRYLSTSKGIDLNLARSLGFKETKAVFVTRQTLGLISPMPMGEALGRLPTGGVLGSEIIMTQNEI